MNLRNISFENNKSVYIFPILILPSNSYHHVPSCLWWNISSNTLEINDIYSIFIVVKRHLTRFIAAEKRNPFSGNLLNTVSGLLDKSLQRRQKINPTRLRPFKYYFLSYFEDITIKVHLEILWVFIFGNIILWLYFFLFFVIIYISNSKLGYTRAPSGREIGFMYHC